MSGEILRRGILETSLAGEQGKPVRRKMKEGVDRLGSIQTIMTRPRDTYKPSERPFREISRKPR